jgi:hypothetical protein
MIRKEFSGTVPKTNMGIFKILSDLSSGETPLLSLNNKTNNFSVNDPRYLMCIRTALYKDTRDSKVKKKNFLR